MGVRRQKGSVSGGGSLGWVGPMYYESSGRDCGVVEIEFSFIVFFFVRVVIVC